MRQVVLIGPACVGKSTLLPVLAARLGRPAIDLDEVAEAYYEEVGHGREELNRVGAARGDLGAYLWWQEAHPHAVRRVLADYPDAVVALGAGHTTYADSALFDEVRSVLAACDVVLLLPNSDAEDSIRTLRDRTLALNDMDWLMDGIDILEQWVAGAQNRELCSVTVYAEGLSTEALADAVLDALSAHHSARDSRS